MSTTPRRLPRAQARRQRGAALLTAMVIVTLIVTLAASMVWQQWRAVQVEVAERARLQAAWILAGALDWARLILREDARSNRPTSLDQPWAMPLEEARLSTFLAADTANADDAPEAFLAGAISDAQARYNLNNLVDPAEGKVVESELVAFRALCTNLSLSEDVAVTIANGLRDGLAKTVTNATPLSPGRVSQLTWLGVAPDTLRALEPYVTLLPFGTKVNVNTAPREVLAAVIPGLDLASAERLIQDRKKPYEDLSRVKALFPQLATAGSGAGSTAGSTTGSAAGSGAAPSIDSILVVRSDYFEVRGRLRLTDRVLEVRSLVWRKQDNQVVVIQRERVSSREST